MEQKQIKLNKNRLNFEESLDELEAERADRALERREKALADR